MSDIFKAAAFAEAVRSERMTRKLSRVDAGKQAGVNKRTIADIENKVGVPQMGTFLKLCTWMQRQPGEFFEGL